MQVSLKPMNEETFREYLNLAIPSYAKNNIESGRWDENGSLEKSKKEYDHLLPEGLESKNNYLFNVIEHNNNNNVGYIWVKVDSKSAFIYDIGIFEDYRRKGYAKSALNLIEGVVSKLGVTSIGLHVFHQNSGAQDLYNNLGYQVVSHNMCKAIST
ncbi:GNAT family N-acetyltransferase [Vibrio nigripulchritudo]|uniref:GNAT family N-acetyltransferase n=1 Tax=Vibrio nigripulchritudo TaxID=28173 RepID=UPI0005F9F94E|nr:GNAT family N-acetyltransferase [Vibrio nigripulchritudo]KJY73823.1 GCN5 family acetyltransferase [Vibrio nigripulchritudo]